MTGSKGRKNGTSSLVYGCAKLIIVSLLLTLPSPMRSLAAEKSETCQASLSTYMEITMFNWTNSQDVLNPDVKPLLTEMGPYVFRERYQRTNITVNNNGTITYHQMRTWEFLPDKSNGTLDDEITHLNVIATSVGYIVRNENELLKLGINILLNGNDVRLIWTGKVRELLFDGLDDQLLSFLAAVESSLLPYPWDKFGWFFNRNGSSSYDGVFNMNVFDLRCYGDIDTNNLGKLHSWNYKSTTDFYSGDCSKITGTTGRIWPPNMKNDEDISVFLPDICRSITLSPDDANSTAPGSKWTGDERMFDNGLKYPPNLCFCTGSECPDLKAGVVNVSDCQYSIPAFVSHPHFYLADPSFSESVSGMEPIKDKHEFSITLDPVNGTPLELNARLQMNILLQPISSLTLFENVPKVMLPVFWVSQTSKPNDELEDACAT